MTMKVYYLSSYSGKSKTSGKDYNQLHFLEYNANFGNWSSSSVFVDKVPDICKSLRSGDLIEIEIAPGGMGRKSKFDRIIKKVSDSPFVIPA